VFLAADDRANLVSVEGLNKSAIARVSYQQSMAEAPPTSSRKINWLLECEVLEGQVTIACRGMPGIVNFPKLSLVCLVLAGCTTGAAFTSHYIRSHQTHGNWLGTPP
jgi:hypothetical protein